MGRAFSSTGPKSETDADFKQAQDSVSGREQGELVGGEGSEAIDLRPALVLTGLVQISLGIVLPEVQLD